MRLLRTGTSLRRFLLLGMSEGCSRIAMLTAVLLVVRRYAPAQAALFSLALTLGVSCYILTIWGTERSAFNHSLDGRQRGRRAALRIGAFRCLIAVPAGAIAVAVLTALGGDRYLLPVLLSATVGITDMEFLARAAGLYGVAYVPRVIAAAVALGLIAGHSNPPHALAVYYTLWSVANLGLAAYSVSRLSVDASGPSYEPPAYRQMLLGGVAAAAGPVIYFSDQFLLAGYKSLGSAATYILAYRFVAPSLSSLALSQAVHVPGLRAGDPSQRGKYLRFNLWLSAVVFGGVLLLALVVQDEFLSAHYHALTLLTGILLIQLPLVALSDVNTRSLLAADRYRQLALLDGSTIVVALASYLTLIPELGVAGALIGTLLSQTWLTVGSQIVWHSHGRTADRSTGELLASPR